MVNPKQLSEKYFPGLGEQHVVGMSGLGYSWVEATLVANTVQTDAQVIAAPPNTGTGGATGPVVHSLGAAPSFVHAQLSRDPSQGLGYGLQFQYITADSSAVYYRAYSWTGVVPRGVAVRVLAVR